MSSSPDDLIVHVYSLLALEVVVVVLPDTLTSWEFDRLCEAGSLTHILTPKDLGVESAPVLSDPEYRLYVLDSGRSITYSGPAVGLLTSGTTGKVRLAVRSAAAVLAESTSYQDALGLTTNDVIASPLPLHHAYGFGLCAVGALLNGVTTFYLPKAPPRSTLAKLALTGATLFPAVPSLLRVLASAGEGDRSDPPLRTLSAGASLDARTAMLVNDRLGWTIGQVYGTTETGLLCLHEPDDWRTAVEWVGAPVLGVEVAIRADGPAIPKAPSPGVVIVKSPAMLDGYLDGDRLDTECFDRGYFVTGDLGLLDGGRLSILGRTSTAINIAGIKVSPEEVESALLEYETVTSALVVPVDDALMGQRIKAIVTPDSVDLTSLRAFCEGRLPAMKLPTYYQAVAELSTTPLGKIIRPRREPGPSIR